MGRGDRAQRGGWGEATNTDAEGSDQPPPAQPPAAQPTAERTAYAILFAISFSHLLNDTMQSLIPSIYPLVKEGFQLSYTQVGLITFTFQLSASLLQPFVGYFTDKRPQPYSLAIGMGFTLRAALGDERYEEHKGHVAQVLAGRGVRFDGKASYKGRDACFQAHLVPDREADGTQRGFYAMSFDITALKRAQDQQARIERQLKPHPGSGASCASAAPAGTTKRTCMTRGTAPTLRPMCT